MEKKLIKQIITEKNPETQFNFLKLYPAFKFSQNIIKIWISVYKKNCLEKTKSLDKYEFIKMKGKLVENIVSSEAIPKGELMLSTEKNNIIEFLIIGLKNRFIKYSFKDISTIVKLMKDNRENPKYINLIQVYFMNPKKKYGHRKTMSSGESNNFVDFIDLDSQSTSIKNIFNITNDDFVSELNMRYYDIIKNIHVHELLSYCIDESQKGDLIGKLSKEFEKLSFYVPTEILLKCKNDKTRIKFIIKIIKIAEKCVEYNNFHALFSIIGGLTHQSIQRIPNLWKLKKKYSKKLEKLRHFIDEKDNFAYYRGFIQDNREAIPYMGIIFSDIKHLLENPIYDKNNGKINYNIFNKLLELVDMIESISIGNLERKNDIANYIDTLYYVKNEDQLYDISYKIVKPVNKQLQKKEIDIKYKTLNTIKRDKLINNLDLIPVEKWKVDHVVEWLVKIDMAKYENIFREHEITGDSLLELTDEYLKNELNIRILGNRITILKRIRNLKHNSLF